MLIGPETNSKMGKRKKKTYYLEKNATSKVNKSKLKIKRTKDSETNDFTIPFNSEIQKLISNAHAAYSSIRVKHNG